MWLTAQNTPEKCLKNGTDGKPNYTYIYIIHIAFILIYAPWPTKKTTVAHYWAMAHRLKTPALKNATDALCIKIKKLTEINVILHKMESHKGQQLFKDVY